ncbi:UNVERIFIED_CONTAM: hypothetical protein Sangu_2969500 [Sesamum angustifolium]|uniref:Uncharacterized protein n=1 Tax=Sesamum angustifolium TaxID=2727405 RepID=A0AAW2IIW5_9LAMI
MATTSNLDVEAAIPSGKSSTDSVSHPGGSSLCHELFLNSRIHFGGTGICGWEVFLGSGLQPKKPLAFLVRTLQDEEEGPNPLSIWRSVLAARPLLTEGIRWEVGDVKSMKVEGDPWSPSPPTFRLIFSLKSLFANATVSLLLGADCNWSQELIREEFAPIDVVCILQIVPGIAQNPDEQI